MSAPLMVTGRLVTTGAPVQLTLDGGRIAASAPLPASQEETLPWLGPGLVDLQVNGYAGLDFNQPPLAGDLVARLTQALWQEGVTAYLPTIITNSDDAIGDSMQAIAAARASDPLLAATVAGIHLEGPFISPEDGPRGAHARAWVRPPDWARFQRWQDAADGAIRLVTLSPEWPDAPDFIARCVASGVAVAIGHTAATTEQIDAAVAAGARLSTHFGNGAHPLLPRHPNYLWAQLARDELAASLIGDGWHLPDAVLKVVMRVKGDGALLVSDTAALAGLPPGEYSTPVGGRVTLTADGRLVLADDPRLLAGSVCPLRGAVAQLARRGLADLPTAWAMASTRPARFLGLPASAGLAVGAPADLVLFTWDGDAIAVQRTYKAGQIVYESAA
ncbi:MAG TPA: amidohydrolase family protein [Thermomicrobiales bacterium]|nr:amidohydrolase family protein [Thermomicrobiales bacterium]